MLNKILVVDDDDNFRAELKDYLEEYPVLEASSGEEALRLLKRAHDIEVVLLDVMMPRINGIDVLTEIKKTDPNLAIIILTGYSSKDVAIEALKAHADDYIEKPMDVARIKESIEKVLEIKRSEGSMGEDGIDGKIEKVKRFIETNCYKKITLDDVAKVVFLSPKYLSETFKEKLGVGFSEYKLKIKTDKAKELLQKTALNVNQVSDKLGYENPESFIRQFKKFANCTPTEFRNKIRNKKSKARKNSRKKLKKAKKAKSAK
jgi:two-component system, response regulator YesN